MNVPDPADISCRSLPGTGGKHASENTELFTTEGGPHIVFRYSSINRNSRLSKHVQTILVVIMMCTARLGTDRFNSFTASGTSRSTIAPWWVRLHGMSLQHGSYSFATLSYVSAALLSFSCKYHLCIT